MLDVATHMLLLQQQAQIKNERPEDGSFLPVSLTIACLLRQLPMGLAPPAGVLSFHQLDRLPLPVLEHKLAKLLLDEQDPMMAFEFVRSIALYAKMTRALLRICHDHLQARITSVEALQELIGVVVSTLEIKDDESVASEDPKMQDKPQERSEMPETSKRTSSKARSKSHRAGKQPPPQPPVRPTRPEPVAADPSGIMKRAVGRDNGDGSTVVEIMRKYPSDQRIQSHGVRALKGVVRRHGAQLENQSQASESDSMHQRGVSRQRHRRSYDSDGSDGSSDENENTQVLQDPAAILRNKHIRDAIDVVIGRMQKYPDALDLQRDGLFCLSEFAHQDEVNVPFMTCSGAIVSIMDALARLPDDTEAHIAGLSVLAHPQIADDNVVRVNPESRRLVLSAMKRFPLSEQIQGLSCLALANLSLRQDESRAEIVAKGGLEVVVAAMKRFRDTSLVQAAGCWLIGIISSANDEMRAACLEAGGLPVCEKARVRFPEDPKVQQHSVYAINTMLQDDIDETSIQTRKECTVQ